MNRREMIILTAAGLLPVSRPPTPETPDGDTWAAWAEGVARWELNATRGAFGRNWHVVPQRDFIPWNHAREDAADGQHVCALYANDPAGNAGAELRLALMQLELAGVPTLGLAETDCGYVAAAFVWGNYATVGRTLAGWRVPLPRDPRMD